MVKIAKNNTQNVGPNKNPIDVSAKVNDPTKASKEATRRQEKVIRDLNNQNSQKNVNVTVKVDPNKTGEYSIAQDNIVASNSLENNVSIEASNTLKNTDDVSVKSDIELDNTESLTTVVDPKQLGRYEFLEKQSDGTISVKDLGEEVFTCDAAKAQKFRVSISLSMIGEEAKRYVLRAWGDPAFGRTISLSNK